MITSILLSFFAGTVSFLSPCILPLVPGFLAYLAGASTTDREIRRKDVLTNACFFVLGFSTVFALLGVLLNTLLSSVAYDVRIWISRIGGVLIVLFGLYLIGLIRFSFLNAEYKFRVTRTFSSRYLTSFVFGAAFAAGWTPCIGAVLGSILTLAAIQPGSAFFLLLAYGLGLGLPFLVISLFFGAATDTISRLLPKAAIIVRLFGVILVLLGILVFSQQLGRIAGLEFIQQLFPVQY